MPMHVVFMECFSNNFPCPTGRAALPAVLGGRHYFVATSEVAALHDTNQGKRFGHARFTNYKFISEDDMRTICATSSDLLKLEQAIQAVGKGEPACYYLGCVADERAAAVA